MIQEKRDRLIEAAKKKIYEQGAGQTTLADIAQCAQVPLGNVYYYFRTKDALIEAVLQAHICEIQLMIAQLEQLSDPRQRLLRWLETLREQAPTFTRYGCPHGSLGLELGKEYSTLNGVVEQLFRVTFDWMERQFRLLNKDAQQAWELAFDLGASLQGTLLLALCFRSPELLEHKIQRLEEWISSL